MFKNNSSPRRLLVLWECDLKKKLYSLPFNMWFLWCVFIRWCVTRSPTAPWNYVRPPAWWSSAWKSSKRTIPVVSCRCVTHSVCVFVCVHMWGCVIVRLHFMASECPPGSSSHSHWIKKKNFCMEVCKLKNFLVLGKTFYWKHKFLKVNMELCIIKGGGSVQPVHLSDGPVGQTVSV